MSRELLGAIMKTVDSMIAVINVMFIFVFLN